MTTTTVLTRRISRFLRRADRGGGGPRVERSWRPSGPAGGAARRLSAAMAKKWDREGAGEELEKRGLGVAVETRWRIALRESRRQYDFGFVMSIGLKYVIELDILDAIHECGGSDALGELATTIVLVSSRLPRLRRLMLRAQRLGAYYDNRSDECSVWILTPSSPTNGEDQGG
ncbi:hypothetical protein ZWY2020_002553 [Hordeum vulgare]|nr:hypothetical protein ZWY2020_002553 [Hordeum vulgare]